MKDIMVSYPSDLMEDPTDFFGKGLRQHMLSYFVGWSGDPSSVWRHGLNRLDLKGPCSEACS